MNKSVEKFINRIKQDKKLLFIILLGLSGMVLLLFSGSSDRSVKEEKTENTDVYETAEKIEKELEELLRTVDGAGKVKVMVTLDCLEERSAAKNTESESSDSSSDTNEEYVLIDSDNGTDGLILKTTAPVIRGVGISCQGAVSPTVKQELTRLTSAALGVPVNRIWVTKMKE